MNKSRRTVEKHLRKAVFYLHTPSKTIDYSCKLNECREGDIDAITMSYGVLRIFWCFLLYICLYSQVINNTSDNFKKKSEFTHRRF
jgi:hypothetical protein